MKKINVIIGILSLGMLFSCGSKKPPTTTPTTRGEVLIQNYCSGEEYFSTSKAFRSNAIGESMDQTTAKKKARSNAQAELAKSISSTMKIVGDNFVKSSEFNNKEEVTETFNEMARTVVDQTLSGAVKICEKFTKTSNGTYKCYMALELKANSILDAYKNKLSSKEQLKADYNYEKFKDTFNQEMKKLEESRN